MQFQGSLQCWDKESGVAVIQRCRILPVLFLYHGMQFALANCRNKETSMLYLCWFIKTFQYLINQSLFEILTRLCWRNYWAAHSFEKQWWYSQGGCGVTDAWRLLPEWMGLSGWPDAVFYSCDCYFPICSCVLKFKCNPPLALQLYACRLLMSLIIL